jgi:hypothetical protein
MGNKDKDHKSSFFEKKEEKPIEEPKKEPKKRLNDPSVPMRRKNRILNDGRDWFDTHPDA